MASERDARRRERGQGRMEDTCHTHSNCGAALVCIETLVQAQRNETNEKAGREGRAGELKKKTWLQLVSETYLASARSWGQSGEFSSLAISGRRENKVQLQSQMSGQEGQTCKYANGSVQTSNVLLGKFREMLRQRQLSREAPLQRSRNAQAAYAR